MRAPEELPGDAPHPARDAGADSDALLRDAGLRVEEITALRGDDVVR